MTGADVLAALEAGSRGQYRAPRPAAFAAGLGVYRLPAHEWPSNLDRGTWRMRAIDLPDDLEAAVEHFRRVVLPLLMEAMPAGLAAAAPNAAAPVSA